MGLKKPENCGNEELHERVEEAVANLVSVDMSDNIREILGDSIFDDEVIHVVVDVDCKPEDNGFLMLLIPFLCDSLYPSCRTR